MKPTILKNMNILAIVAMLFLSACTNLEKAIEKGNYDLAIQTAVKKLRGKTRKKAKYVAALEEGFRSATDNDMARIASLKRRNTADSWQKIHRVALGIEGRQEMIKPLLPVIDREGYKANFKFVKIDGIINESNDMAAKLLYNEARAHLVQAEKGNKERAKEAYHIFQKVRRIDPNYRDVIALSNEAHQLGIVHIRYRVNNHSNGQLPRAAVDRLKNLNTNGMSTFWEKFYIGGVGNGVKIDFEMNLNVQRIDMSPGLVNEKEFFEQKEIKVGYSEVVEQVVIATDSLGKETTKDKIVQVPKFAWVKAEVIRTIQKREACVHAIIEVKDVRNGGVVKRLPISSTINFENCYIEFFGDERALSAETRRHLNNRPLPFPTDRKMLTDAACQMAPQVSNRIKKMNLS